MKYNTFWGYIFWTLLLLSTVSDLRPILINFWEVLYNGSFGNVHVIFWIPIHILLIAVIVLKVSLLRWFFPRKRERRYDLFGTREICGLCAGMSTFLALPVLIAVIMNGGLKTYQIPQMIQIISYLSTPFMFIYYLVREEER